MKRIRKWQRIFVLALLFLSVCAPIVLVSYRLKTLTLEGARDFVDDLSSIKISADSLKLSALEQKYVVEGLQPGDNYQFAMRWDFALFEMLCSAAIGCDEVELSVVRNSIEEVIADPDAETTEDLLIKQFMKLDIEKVLDTLTQREKQVIKWRFGMGDGRTKTLQEIGELMGVSRERIRQIESSAFRKLTNKKRTKHLQQYLYI